MAKRKTTKTSRKRIGSRKGAKTKRTTAATRIRAGGRRARATPARGSSKAAKDLAALQRSLQVEAKTPEQRADASIVGLAQQHLEKGDYETVGSLLNKVGTWVGSRLGSFVEEHQEHIKQHLAHVGYELLKKLR